VIWLVAGPYIPTKLVRARLLTWQGSYKVVHMRPRYAVGQLGRWPYHNIPRRLPNYLNLAVT